MRSCAPDSHSQGFECQTHVALCPTLAARWPGPAAPRAARAPGGVSGGGHACVAVELVVMLCRVYTVLYARSYHYIGFV